MLRVTGALICKNIITFGVLHPKIKNPQNASYGLTEWFFDIANISDIIDLAIICFHSQTEQHYHDKYEFNVKMIQYNVMI